MANLGLVGRGWRTVLRRDVSWSPGVGEGVNPILSRYSQCHGVCSQHESAIACRVVHSVVHSVMASVHKTKVRLLVASFTAFFTVPWRLFTRRKCDCLSRRSQTVYNTKGTRAHTHREVIRKWLWEPKGSVHSIMVSVHRNKETKP